MKDEGQQDWGPEKKINWATTLLVVVLINCLMILLMSLGILWLPHGGLFWIGTGTGLALALILNCCRPRYQNAGRFWKPVYDFLMVQMPPPD